jgi:hypothetical protein
VLAGGRDCPIDLRVNAGAVTWVDQGSLQNSAQDGVVATIPAAGCANPDACMTVLASDQASPSAVEVVNGNVYWASVYDGAVWYLPAGQSTREIFAAGQDWPRWLAADETALYWINSGSLGASNGEVRRSWLDEPGVGGMPIVSALESPLAITLNDFTVYWTNYGVNDIDGHVMRADVTGTPWEVIAQNQSAPRGIAASDAFVYWANSEDGTIMRSLPTGADPIKLVSGLSTPSDVAIDTGAIYWVEAGTPSVFLDGSVKAAKLDGSGIVTLASDQKNPRRLVLDADHVYWINRGTAGVSPCTQHDGEVVRITKPW